MSTQEIADDCREGYYHEKASEVARYLALPALGVAWLFKFEVGGKIVFPKLLAHAIFLIVIGLLIDLLYYLVGTTSWGQRGLRWVFWLKMVAFVAGYGVLAWFLGTNTYTPVVAR